MRQVSRRAVVAARWAAPCSPAAPPASTAGAPVPASRPTSAADQFPITGRHDSDVDRFARNALADLDDFWSEAYPEFFGEDFTPLEGGYWSVDTEDLD